MNKQPRYKIGDSIDYKFSRRDHIDIGTIVKFLGEVQNDFLYDVQTTSVDGSHVVMEVVRESLIISIEVRMEMLIERISNL